VTPRRTLDRLARLLGAQTSYLDIARRRRHASRDALVATLKALGAEVNGPDDVAGALRALERDATTRVVEPVVVAWGGRVPPIELRLPVAGTAQRVRMRLEEEEGAVRTADVDTSVPVRSLVLDGRTLAVHRCAPGWVLPLGWHRLLVDVGTARHEATVIAAPRRAAHPRRAREWGVFAPTYALRSADDRGVGDLGDLRTLVDWTASLGGTTVATLPLLAAFLDEPFEPSPYRPVSRCLWNELYVDLARLPEVREVPAVRALLEEPAARATVAELRAGADVDYRAAMALTRRVLTAAAVAIEQAPPARRAAFEAHRRSAAHVADYARFRAHGERIGRSWRAWADAPAPDPAAERYHAYAQWVMEEQLDAIRVDGAPALYLDVPLGVHPDGYDTWREGELFLADADVGAPPDTFQPAGQAWGIPPLDPRVSRARGHRYVADCLRQQMRHARYLRLDHVMGFHRLFLVPHGFSARDGVYVRYPAEEMWAVVCLESHRSGCVVVGEDLGTVPREVGTALRRHGIAGMFVQPFELAPDRAPALPDASCVASLNTHDMYPFAAYWDGSDLPDRVARGVLTPAQADAERRQRAAEHAALRRALETGGLPLVADAAAVLRHALVRLAASATPLLVVTLEDLWGERRPQNVPGTPAEAGNWVHKLARTLEELRASDDVRTLVAVIAAGRQR